MEHQKVFVIDFGGQYTQLIVRRIRELGVYSEMIPWTTAFARITEEKPDAVVLSGGPKSVLDEGAPTIDFSVLEGIPVLGICYGMQLMAHNLGGEVHKAQGGEYGFASITAPSGFLEGVESSQVWMSHFDQVGAVPPGFSVTAVTDVCPIAAMENGTDRFAVQFHVEVTHTPAGKEILRRFLFDKCRLRGDWTSESFIEDQVRLIREKVGDGKVLCAVSGGVDSSVMAALLIKAIGDQAVCVFVDHGLMRKGEAAQVIETFNAYFRQATQSQAMPSQSNGLHAFYE
ncbi:MAG: glutamine-hydrolyzing GMP synthase, partial [Fimbriimonadaceae bacterium]